MHQGPKAKGCIVSGRILSEGEAGPTLSVWDSVAKAQDKVTTADDDFSRSVRDKWCRHLLVLARNSVDTTTSAEDARYWSKVFAQMTFDEDGDVLEAEVEDDCSSDCHDGMLERVDSASEDEGMPDVQLAVVNQQMLRQRRMLHSSRGESIVVSRPFAD